MKFTAAVLRDGTDRMSFETMTAVDLRAGIAGAAQIMRRLIVIGLAR